MNKNLFAILPYLKTSKETEIRGIKFNNSKDVSKYPLVIQKHLKTLFNMFFLRDNLRIKEMSFAYIKLDGTQENESKIIRKLIEVHNLLVYFYSAPHPQFLDTFLNKENSNIYIFKPSKISKYLLFPNDNVINEKNRQYKFNHREETDGYKGTINNESPFSVAEGCRIYPQIPHIVLNIIQDLYVDFNQRISHKHNKAIISLINNDKGLQIEKKLFTSLNWYNRSISENISDDEALINLAVAFESLLELKGKDNLKNKFKEAIALLIGSVQKLDSWSEQFYNARSQAVHEGLVHNFMFNPVDKNKNIESEYRSLISYGRRIFQICFGTIVMGSEMANEIDLPSLFLTNRERFENICKKINTSSESSKNKILSIKNEINDINKYQFIPESELKVDTMLNCIDVVVQTYLDTKPKISPKLSKYLLDLLKRDTDEMFYKLSIIEKIVNYIRNDENLKSQDSKTLYSLVYSLINSVWQYTYTIHYHLEVNHFNRKLIIEKESKNK